MKPELYPFTIKNTRLPPSNEALFTYERFWVNDVVEDATQTKETQLKS